MSNLKWIPESLHDEGGPAPLDKPEDWLNPDFVEDHTYLINPAPGDIVLFSTFEDHGEFTVTIAPDGTIASALRCPDTPDMLTGQTGSPDGSGKAIPKEANWFWIPLEDAAAATVEELALEWGEYCPGEDMVFQSATWTENVKMRLSADGNRFERVE